MSDSVILWNKEKALSRMMGKQALLDKVTAMFMEQFPTTWESTKADLANRNWVQVKAQAHTLKGSAAELGLEALADALLSLERAAATQNEASADQALGLVVSVSEPTLALLNK